MMSIVKSIAMLMLLLCMLLGPTHASEVMQSPTVAPTSAPTSVIDDEAAPADSGDSGEEDEDEEEAANSTNASAVNGSNASVTTSVATETTQTEAPADTPVISFVTKMKVNSASDFDKNAYLQSIAESTGVSADNVVVKSIDFVIEVKYTFEDNVEEADVKKGAAEMAGVSEDSVQVTLETVRRLQMGRRLAVAATVAITTQDSTAANLISTRAADPAKLTEGIEAATNKVIALPTVTAAPSMEVIVTTEVKSETGAEVVAPTPEALAAKLKEKTGKDFSVVVSDATESTTSNSTTTEEADLDTESSFASKQDVTTAFFIVLASSAAVLGAFPN